MRLCYNVRNQRYSEDFRYEYEKMDGGTERDSCEKSDACFVVSLGSAHGNQRKGADFEQ